MTKLSNVQQQDMYLSGKVDSIIVLTQIVCPSTFFKVKVIHRGQGKEFTSAISDRFYLISGGL